MTFYEAQGLGAPALRCGYIHRMEFWGVQIRKGLGAQNDILGYIK